MHSYEYCEVFFFLLFTGLQFWEKYFNSILVKNKILSLRRHKLESLRELPKVTPVVSPRDMIKFTSSTANSGLGIKAPWRHYYWENEINCSPLLGLSSEQKAHDQLIRLKRELTLVSLANLIQLSLLWAGENYVGIPLFLCLPLFSKNKTVAMVEKRGVHG